MNNNVVEMDTSEVKPAASMNADLNHLGPHVQLDLCLKEAQDEKMTRPTGSNSVTTEDVDASDEDFDPWALPELKDQGVNWSDLTLAGKILRVAVVVTKICLLFVLLYMFVCSLDLLASAFRLLGGKAAGKVFQQNELLHNPIVGLMIGVLATVLVQSSSTSTSIVVTMVGADFLDVKTAIPIVMGANIGTSVTNTLVSLAHSSDRNEFRRAFGGAVVHDMFNWLSVIVLLPLEVASGYLYHLSGLITRSTKWQASKSGKQELLKVITKPLTKRIIQLDKNVIKAIAKGASHDSLVKECCKKKVVTEYYNRTVNGTTELIANNETVCTQKCEFLLQGLGWGDTGLGLLLLGISLVLLCFCLLLLVKVLHSMLKGRIAVVIKKTINADFPGVFSYFTGYIAMLVGCGMTILVQSSSIFTSALTPLVGIGVISLERMYPLTLGSNIGTTATGILASFAANKDKLGDTLQIALCHFLFNISGILIFYPIPMFRIPIRMAKKLGDTTAKYRWFSIMYLVIMFLLLPTFVFTLSLAGMVVFLAVGIPLLTLLLAVVIINVIQNKRPSMLPVRLQSWSWLPEWMHSFKPLDRQIKKTRFFIEETCICRKQKVPPTSGQVQEEFVIIKKSTSQAPIMLEYSIKPNDSNGVENVAFENVTKL